MRRRPRFYIAFLSVVALLLALRLMLPLIVTKYVNHVLQGMNGYHGSVSDVDINLYRGAYTLHDLKIFKIHGNETKPFIDIPVMDLSVEWKALLHGAIVGEVGFTNPHINLVRDVANKSQAGEGENWVAVLERLSPVRINHFEIVNGEVYFYDFVSKPKVDIGFKSVQLTASNLSNVRDRESPLPSTISGTATSIGDGELTLDMRMNALKEIPDFDLDLKFENVDMPALNDFFRAYANVDVETGTFYLYAELAAEDGRLQGYIKPMATGMKVVDLKKDSDHPVRMLWEMIVGALTEIFKNKPNDQLATKVPLAGDLNDPDIGYLTAIWNIVRNGFVDAFSKNTDGSIQFRGANGNE